MRALNLTSVAALLTAYGSLTAACIVGEGNQALEVVYDVAWFSVIALMLVQLFTTKNCLDFDNQFVFYASYHDHFANQVIHLMFVWPILATALIFLSFTNYDVISLSVYGVDFDLHIACTFFALCYFIYYLILERRAGVMAALLVASVWTNATFLSQGKQTYTLSTAAIVHLIAWVAQFVGHGLLEGRAPALLDNLAQSFFMAPLFVIVEALSWCGYRRVDFEKIKEQVQANIKDFKEAAERKKTPTGQLLQ